MTTKKQHPRHRLESLLINSDLTHKSAVNIKTFMEDNFDKTKMQSIHSVITQLLETTYPAKKKPAKKPSQQFMKPMTPSKALAEIVGSKPLPRTMVVTKIWEYIKKNNLQNPKNKRNIICDEKLAAVMKKKEVTMFELAGIVGANLT